MGKKQTKLHEPFSKVVWSCWAILIIGSLLLAYLMETREMAPPRKYEVNMKGDIIGVDNGPKIPVLTPQEAAELKQKKDSIRAPKQHASSKPKVENEPKAADLIVPSHPEDNGNAAQTAAPAQRMDMPKQGINVAKPEMSAPKVEKIE